VILLRKIFLFKRNAQHFFYEVIAKPLGTPASRRQSPEKCGHYVRNPAKPEGFAITCYNY